MTLRWLTGQSVLRQGWKPALSGGGVAPPDELGDAISGFSIQSRKRALSLTLWAVRIVRGDAEAVREPPDMPPLVDELQGILGTWREEEFEKRLAALKASIDRDEPSTEDAA